MRTRQVTKYLSIAILAVLFLYLAESAGLQNRFSQKAILVQLESLGSFAPLGFMAVMALTVASPLPSLPLDIIAGIFFGPYLGTSKTSPTRGGGFQNRGPLKAVSSKDYLTT